MSDITDFESLKTKILGRFEKKLKGQEYDISFSETPDQIIKNEQGFLKVISYLSVDVKPKFLITPIEEFSAESILRA